MNMVVVMSSCHPVTEHHVVSFIISVRKCSTYARAHSDIIIKQYMNKLLRDTYLPFSLFAFSKYRTQLGGCKYFGAVHCNSEYIYSIITALMYWLCVMMCIEKIKYWVQWRATQIEFDHIMHAISQILEYKIIMIEFYAEHAIPGTRSITELDS